MAKDQEARRAMVAVRLLAVANLAYVYTESNFDKNIFAPMSEDPKRLQLPQQLAGLVQPIEAKLCIMMVSTFLRPTRPP